MIVTLSCCIGWFVASWVHCNALFELPWTIWSDCCDTVLFGCKRVLVHGLVKDGATAGANKSFNLLQIQADIFRKICDKFVIGSTGRNEALWMLPELSATAALEN